MVNMKSLSNTKDQILFANFCSNLKASFSGPLNSGILAIKLFTIVNYTWSQIVTAALAA
jgi:hypothetical protein